MLRLVATVALLTAGAGALALPDRVPDRELAQAASFGCRVVWVHDGDTLTCADGTRVRLHAVAARELDETCRPGHPCPAASGVSARAALERMALGERLECEATGPSFARVAALCRTPAGMEINCAMVQGGHASVWPRFNRQRPICAGG